LTNDCCDVTAFASESHHVVVAWTPIKCLDVFLWWVGVGTTLHGLVSVSVTKTKGLCTERSRSWNKSISRLQRQTVVPRPFHSRHHFKQWFCDARCGKRSTVFPFFSIPNQLVRYPMGHTPGKCLRCKSPTRRKAKDYSCYDSILANGQITNAINSLLYSTDSCGGNTIPSVESRPLDSGEMWHFALFQHESSCKVTPMLVLIDKGDHVYECSFGAKESPALVALKWYKHFHCKLKIGRSIVTDGSLRLLSFHPLLKNTSSLQ